jgi:hypothetical protein
MVPFALLVAASGPTYAQSAEPTSTAESDANQAPAPPWPRVIHSDATTLTLYEPRPESWDGKQLKATSAVAVRRNAGENSETPLYGAVHLEARSSPTRFPIRPPCRARTVRRST